MEPEPKAGHFA